MKQRDISAICYAIAAAVFYALNVPCSKLLLDHVAPTFMAAFLYLGAGFGVGVMYLFHHKQEKRQNGFRKLICRTQSEWFYLTFSPRYCL